MPLVGAGLVAGTRPAPTNQLPNFMSEPIVYNYTHMLSVVINAGGESRRMGENKALKLFAGQPLVARMLARLGGLAGEILITSNQPELYEFLNVPVLPDLLPGRGALGGLYTALAGAHQPVVAVVACDMPFISPALIAAQQTLLLEQAVDVVIPHSPAGAEPLHAVYRREACLAAVQGALEQGVRRMDGWYERVRSYHMPSEAVARIDPRFNSFINLNTPNDFLQAEQAALAEPNL